MIKPTLALILKFAVLSLVLVFSLSSEKTVLLLETILGARPKPGGGTKPDSVAQMNLWVTIEPITTPEIDAVGEEDGPGVDNVVACFAQYGNLIPDTGLPAKGQTPPRLINFTFFDLVSLTKVTYNRNDSGYRIVTLIIEGTSLQNPKQTDGSRPISIIGGYRRQNTLHARTLRLSQLGDRLKYLNAKKGVFVGLRELPSKQTLREKIDIPICVSTMRLTNQEPPFTEVSRYSPIIDCESDQTWLS